MAEALTQEQINNVLLGIKIPPQPQILVDLQIEQIMPDPDLNSIASLISRDVGLAGTILKVVNSPFYGLSNKITSVNQAVSLIGLDSVINIVNGLSIKSEMSDETITHMNRFWDTANDIAMIATNVAKKVGYPKPDLAYLLGLFHNSGVPLLMSRFDNYLEVLEQSYSEGSDRIIDVENALLNTNHAVVGYYIAKSWNLPKVLCDAIAEHHNCQRHFLGPQHGETDAKTLLAILKTAEHLCGSFRILGNQEVDHEWELIGAEVLTHLGLGEYDLEQLQANAEEMGISAKNYAF
ncbi:histidine kinase [Oleispira antarctica]|uniref:Histidine kinase n=1 Tax=Oleispira antarctica TaxID=188908 RepID=A0A1Y5I264_OLEAN|nr:histidine kinase [Oleispira antarctica]